MRGDFSWGRPGEIPGDCRFCGGFGGVSGGLYITPSHNSDPVFVQ